MRKLWLGGWIMQKYWENIHMCKLEQRLKRLFLSPWTSCFLLQQLTVNLALTVVTLAAVHRVRAGLLLHEAAVHRRGQRGGGSHRELPAQDMSQSAAQVNTPHSSWGLSRPRTDGQTDRQTDRHMDVLMEVGEVAAFSWKKPQTLEFTFTHGGSPPKLGPCVQSAEIPWSDVNPVSTAGRVSTAFGWNAWGLSELWAGMWCSRTPCPAGLS